MCRGKCPYCGVEVAGAGYEEVKKALREHILAVHRDVLEQLAEKQRRRGRGLPGRSLRGLAGYLASLAVEASGC